MLDPPASSHRGRIGFLRLVVVPTQGFPGLWFGHLGRLPQVRLICAMPGPDGWWWWWCGGGGVVLQSVCLAVRAGAAEAAAQRPPVVLALRAQPLADPRPDRVSAPQQEVHQLHVRSEETKHTLFYFNTGLWCI